MPSIQVIEFAGKPVAVTVGSDRAVISEQVEPEHRALVERMCLYSLQVAAGDRPGTYAAADAERWALSQGTSLERGRWR